MNDYNVIRLQHEFAAPFFEEAMHPSVEELQRRDLFLESITSELSCRLDGEDIVSEIPDIDLTVDKQPEKVNYIPLSRLPEINMIFVESLISKSALNRTNLPVKFIYSIESNPNLVA